MFRESTYRSMPWKCNKCTLINVNQFEKCEVCEGPNEYNEPQLQQIERGLIKCVGDCGSKFAQIIESFCVRNVPNDAEFESIIQSSFAYYDDPLRKSLLHLLRKSQLRKKYHKYYGHLDDIRYVVRSSQQIHEITELFTTLVHDNHKDILQQIANQTCHEADKSLLEEVRQCIQSKLDTLQSKYNAVKQTIAIYEEDNKQDSINDIVLDSLNGKRKEMERGIEEEKAKVRQTNIEQYFVKLEIVKQHPNYKTMQQRNCALSDLEILAVIFYCDVDIYCYKMRQSHRDNELNSCKWKKLYYYLCCAIDKMYYVFHHQNKELFKRNFSLFHGSTICDLNQQTKQCLHLQTITSFTTDPHIAKDFAQRRKLNATENNGMILVIDDANKALVNGTLRGADVRWISKFQREEEYIILPTTFRKFKYMAEREREKRNWWIIDDHNMYITTDVQSTNISSIAFDVASQIDAPISWFPSYDDLALKSAKHMLHIMGAMFGHMKTWTCPYCKVDPRLIEYTGDWAALTIECPACRQYVFRSQPQYQNENHREFDCFTPDCGKIRRSDLQRIDPTHSTLDAKWGYQCTRCGQQQRIAYLRRVAFHEPTLNRKVDDFLDSIDDIIKMHYDDGDKEGNLEDYMLRIRDDREQLKEIVRFIHREENIDVEFMTLFKTFPILWKWILSIRWVKMALDAYKDGYTNLLAKGFIDESNNMQIIKENAEDIGCMVGDRISHIDFAKISGENVKDGIEIFAGFASGIVSIFDINND